ncbi:MAG: Re/Si-specific NAD(P)(+) transhydrogenase subunit alpha [Saprospiraceae bacterium]|nr:Re/Si-specific NAD(P)(+) transhydrogenase subunit alpha [Saprospiraceae bacterium]
MTIGILKESKEGERRVALTPDVAKLLIKKGYEVLVEKGAGEGSFLSDDDYRQVGAQIESDKEVVCRCNFILKVNAPTIEEIGYMQNKACVISMLYGYTRPDILDALNEKSITSFGMDAIPRISRAQRMDALSSQANLAGYKSVIMGCDALGKIFPLLMTAAGTITPAKVLIFGAGVAGLQAIATAHRLGAIVEVTDVRPETKEQVESLGGKFLQVESEAKIETEGGYAKEVSIEFLQKQQQLIETKIKEADLVITTALVIGKKSPVLITEKMVNSMKKGSVIVDMAVEWGGNCELSEMNKTKVHHGVTIIGEANLPSLLPVNASQLYAINISTLLMHLSTSTGLNLDMEEEITKGCLITMDGATVHEFTNKILTASGIK